jgi:hypothetical protein
MRGWEHCRQHRNIQFPGEKVIQGSAEVSQPSTVYVFIGQGSQVPGPLSSYHSNLQSLSAIFDPGTRFAASARVHTLSRFAALRLNGF